MAAQRRKKTTRKRGASRHGSGGVPAFAWFLTGLIAGMAIAFALYLKGYLPEQPDSVPEALTAQPDPSEPALIEEAGDEPEETEGRRFDFFTVLPEMEVVVPDRELSDRATPAGAPAVDEGSVVYVLQAGSFRSAADAEQMKARLALQGIIAGVQVVTVNGETWHRVRVGPVEGARRADELRRQLLEQGFPALVLKDSS
ncbi:MAG: hypothetical protein GWM87_00340 [Xanthomonadales bacterium]|nr:hypothetical protein [Xanthomonadales bacterium]NIX11558.1 hypothetical protein [Xanthomonadales bacterium]